MLYIRMGAGVAGCVVFLMLFGEAFRGALFVGLLVLTLAVLVAVSLSVARELARMRLRVMKLSFLGDGADSLERLASTCLAVHGPELAELVRPALSGQAEVDIVLGLAAGTNRYLLIERWLRDRNPGGRGPVRDLTSWYRTLDRIEECLQELQSRRSA